MNDTWTERWDERYRNEAFAYGEEPNEYLKAQLSKLSAGNILFPADGEGRNSIYAATLGWQVSAFDISIEGQRKALQLAETKKVNIEYQVGELQNLNFKPEQFDALALIYAHFPAVIKSKLHKDLDKLLRKGAVIIFEAFSKKHLEYVTKNERVGGPRDLDSLFSIEEIQADFSNYEVLELVEKEIVLNEGLFHNGTGSVIRFVGRKQ